MFTELTRSEFNNFAITHKNSIFFQSSFWGDLKEGTGWKHFLVGLKEDDEIKAAAILLAKKTPVIGKYIFYSPRGYLLDYSDLALFKEFSDEVIKFVKEHEGIFIKINPPVIYQERDVNGNVVEGGFNNKELVEFLKKEGYEHVGFTTDFGKDIEPRWISVLDLRGKTEEDYRAGLNSTKRLDINNSHKHGLNLVQIDKSRMQEFRDLMEHTAERRGFLNRPVSYYNKMYDSFGDYIKIMLVELDVKGLISTYEQEKQALSEKIAREREKQRPKESRIREFEDQLKSKDKKIGQMQAVEDEHGDKIVVAGGLFMTFGRQVVSVFGASYKQFMKYKGQYFLNDEMIRFSIKNGFDQFNFYGIAGDFNEDSPEYGLFDFKRGFGACVQELIGEFTYVTNPFYNALYNAMYKAYRGVKKLKARS